MSALAIELVNKCFETQEPNLDLGMCGLRDKDFIEGSQLDIDLRKCVHLQGLVLSNAWQVWDERKISIRKKSANKLEGNFFSIYPSALIALINLKTLVSGGERNFRWNITDISLLESLKELQYLNLSYNKITDLSLKYISRLKELITLDIGGNQLRESGPAYLIGLDKLITLDIGRNQINDIGVKDIAKLINLTRLDIGSNHITDDGAIEIATLKKLTTLDIGRNQITNKGAKELATLNNLVRLDIGSNIITDIGAVHIAELKNLVTLDIGSNMITYNGAKSVSELKKLATLDIGGNQITDTGTLDISVLKNLTTLDIAGNQITDIGAMYIAELKNLKSLNISENKITDVGTKYIARLNNITSLVISSNKISDEGISNIVTLKGLTTLDIGDNQISDRGAKIIVGLKNLITLNINKNNITQIDTIKLYISHLKKLSYINIDTEKIDGLPTRIGSNIKALRGWHASEERIPDTLVKMILIGNTTAGKSSFADFLVNQRFENNRQSTHGIQLWRWKTSNNENALQVNIWDFGGQDYYHATHNIFLNDRTLFLLLQTSKEEHMKNADQKQYLPVNYWLGNIRNITNTASNIWYIQSKAENEQMQYLDSSLIRQYSVSRQFKISVKLVSKKEDFSISEFNYFLNCLLQELKTYAKDELPISWVAIRDKYLPIWREEKLYMNSKDFKEACINALKINETLLIDLNKSWDGLLPYLRGCGEISNFTETVLQDDLIFLSAESLTSGIYKVLSRKTLENNGEFTLADLQKIDPINATIYLEVLQAFKIIFEKPNATGVFVAPQYLPENPYTVHFQQLIKVAFIIHFPDYMSRTIITKFLVEYAGSDERNYYWRYGAFFKRHQLNVFVRIDAERQNIYIHVEEGNNKDKFAVMKELFLFFTLREEKEQMPDISSMSSKSSIMDNYKLKDASNVPGEIELSLNDTDFISINDIREAITNKAYKVRSKQGSFIELNAIFHQLLNTSPTMPKKIFLSYSHKDEAYKIELDTHFAALKRSGKIETWQDRQLLPGDDWDKSIEDALLNADIVLLLISPDFMASDYIWNTEIRKAIDKGIKTIPIFLRPCDFKESIFELHKIQGLPKDARWVISNRFSYRDEAYLEIIEGIKNIL